MRRCDDEIKEVALSAVAVAQHERAVQRGLSTINSDDGLSLQPFTRTQRNTSKIYIFILFFRFHFRARWGTEPHVALEDLHLQQYHMQATGV